MERASDVKHELVDGVVREVAQVFRGIASLRTYVLVSQVEPYVEWFERASESWVLRVAQGLEAVAALGTLDVSIPLKELYADVDFAAAQPEPGE